MWSGGKALLAIVQARRGRVDEARRLLQRPPGRGQGPNPIPANARMIIGQELDEFGPLQPIALALYEAALKDETADESIWTSTLSPARRLIAIYKRAGREDDARRRVLKYSRRTGDRYATIPRYAAYRRLQEIASRSAAIDRAGLPGRRRRALRRAARRRRGLPGGQGDLRATATEVSTSRSGAA